MTDHELRQRLTKLRVPPVNPAAANQALDRALTAREQPAEPESKDAHWSTRLALPRTARPIASPRESKWRDWFWPSPFAWGALAAVWMVIGARYATDPRADSGSSPLLVQEGSPDAATFQTLLFARHDFRAFLLGVERPPTNP